MLNVDSMGMHFKGLGSGPCGHERAEVMLDRLEHLTYSYRGRGGEMEERVIQRGKKDEKMATWRHFCVSRTQTR